MNVTREDLVNPETIVKFNAHLPGIYSLLSHRLQIPEETLKLRGNGISRRRGGTVVLPSCVPEA